MNLLWLGYGLWIIPLILLLGSGWAFYTGYKSSKSGSWYWGKDENGVAKKFESDENVKFINTPQFIYGCILFAACVVVLILMYGDR